MAHRTILTPKQREVLFGLPADEPRLLRHYTLSDDDLEHVGLRRRARSLLQLLFNQIGRILTVNEMATITEDVVEAARSTLVIGAN